MKLNDVLLNQLERRARKTEESFHKEFNDLLNKYRFNDTVKWQGLYSLNRDKKDSFDKISLEHFMALETEKFLSELNRLESYFEKKEYY